VGAPVPLYIQSKIECGFPRYPRMVQDETGLGGKESGQNVRVDGLEQTLTASDLLDVGLYTIRGKICCLYCHWTTRSGRGLIGDPRKQHGRDTSDCPIVWSLVAGERIPLIYHLYAEFFSGTRLSQHPEGRPFT
jgi:hypothetical protein